MPSNKKRKYICKGDTPPTKVCPYCRRTYVPLLKLYNGKKGWKNGGFFYDQKYCSRQCSNRARNEGSIDKHGYRVVLYKPNVYEHTIEMERMLGRELRRGETVHHRNGNRADNRPENLELWSSRHGKGQRVADDEPSWLPQYGAGMSLFDEKGRPIAI